MARHKWKHAGIPGDPDAILSTCDACGCSRIRERGCRDQYALGGVSVYRQRTTVPPCPGAPESKR